MSSSFLQTTTQDLWNDGRAMTITATRTADPSSTTGFSLVLTWLLPTAPIAYDGAVVLVAESRLTGANFPIDSTRYAPSSNWAAPADVIEKAQVVASFYGFFGDSVNQTTVTVTNIDPNKIYFASIHACSSVLQYYPIGCQSYPLNAEPSADKQTSPYAGNIPTATVAPENPYDGQAYFDPSTNTVLVWNNQKAIWIRANEMSTRIGEETPINQFQLFYDSAREQLQFFDGVAWQFVSPSNLRVSMGNGIWAAYNSTISQSGLPEISYPGQFIFSTRQAAISAPPVSELWFNGAGGGWYLPTPDLVQVFVNGTWNNISSPGINNFYGVRVPEIPPVGAFFYLTTTRRLKVWSGSDWVSADTDQRGTPTTSKVGVGTSGDYQERLRLINTLKSLLGWPAVCVELNENQFNTAIDNSLSQFRQLADNAYQHRHISYTFYGSNNGGQNVYYLNDPRDKTDKVVNVIKIHRINQLGISSLSAETGLYAQAFFNQLYQGSNVDVLSIHLMNQLSKTYEKIFAGQIMFTWDEAKRELTILRRLLQAQERVVLEVVMEREEGELITDRWTKMWIQTWAEAELLEMLGMIRSKYGTLAGANGGTVLNGDMLLTTASEKKAELRRQILDYEVGNGGVEWGNCAFFQG